MFNNIRLLNKNVDRKINYITLNSNSNFPYIDYSLSDNCYHSLEIVKNNNKEIVKIPKIFFNLGNTTIEQCFFIDNTYILVMSNAILLTKDFINYTTIYQNSIDSFIHRNIFHAVFYKSTSDIYKIYINPNISTEIIDVIGSSSSGDGYKVVNDNLFFQCGSRRISAIIYNNGNYQLIENIRDSISNSISPTYTEIFQFSSDNIYLSGIEIHYNGELCIAYIYKLNPETFMFELCVNKEIGLDSSSFMLITENKIYVYYYSSDIKQYVGYLYSESSESSDLIETSITPIGLSNIRINNLNCFIIGNQFGYFLESKSGIYRTLDCITFTKITTINGHQLSTSININKSQDKTFIIDNGNSLIHEVIGIDKYNTYDISSIVKNPILVNKNVKSDDANTLVKDNNNFYILSYDDTQFQNNIFITKYSLDNKIVENYSLNQTIITTPSFYKINNIFYIYDNNNYNFYDENFNFLSNSYALLGTFDSSAQFFDNKYLIINFNKLLEFDPYTGSVLNTYQITDTTYSSSLFTFFNDTYYTVGKNGDTVYIYKSQDKNLDSFTLTQSIYIYDTFSLYRPIGLFVFKNKLYLYIYFIKNRIEATYIYIYNTNTELFEEINYCKNINKVWIDNDYVFGSDSGSSTKYSKDGIHFYRGNLPNNYTPNICSI